MKFSKATLTLLFLASRASAWTTATTKSSIRLASATAAGSSSSLITSSSSSTRRSRWGTPSSSSLYSTASSLVVGDVKTETMGESQTESFRLGFKVGENNISPWHDVPLQNEDGSYNMVVEIPKMTKAKMEVATKETNNPIAQDMKKGKLRDYHGPIFWNYGCLPQTWEDPTVKHPELNCFGDNDPIDVVEIGSSALSMGSIKSVKPLGVLAMIDDGELDWKVIAIATDDPLADTYNDITDVPDSILAGIREWFRWYKTPDDKPLNSFGFDEQYLNQQSAIEIIHETKEAWEKLMAGTTESGKLWIQK